MESKLIQKLNVSDIEKKSVQTKHVYAIIEYLHNY